VYFISLRRGVLAHPLQLFFLFIFILFNLLFFNKWYKNTANEKNIKTDYQILRTTVAVNFSPNGRLWRLIPTASTIFVDYSDDNGKNYSSPVKINPTPQKISVWAENPPAIVIAQSGRIHLLYYADEQQKGTNFYSYSDDNGKSFSTPVLISDKAHHAMHYLAKMLLDNQDNLFLFWHDARHNHLLNRGELALYYSKTEKNKKNVFENKFMSHGICSCCRMATALDIKGFPVIFTRMVFSENIRDHALFKMDENGQWLAPQRITYDNWQIEACPEHGPALAIDNQNRRHLAWFSLGDKRQGIFYARSEPNGEKISEIMPLGDNKQLAGHPDIITIEKYIAIVWTQFDGNKTTILVKLSQDLGETWSSDKILISSEEKMSHPKLLTNGQQLFLSLTTADQGHQMIEISYEN